MEKENTYLIPISGLALGKHSFQYEITDEFFKGMDYSEIQQGKVSVNLDIDRVETMLTLTFDIEGTVRVMCDRCADEFDQPIDSNQVFYIKLGTENAEESDDVMVMPADQHDFDLTSLIYEFIILSIPMHRVHPEGQCNPEIIDMLNGMQEVAEEDEETIDPRWAALKDIKLNDK